MKEGIVPPSAGASRLRPYYQDSAVTIFHGDCLEVLRTLPDASVDSVVTDPPYGLSFMGKKWDYDVPSMEIWAECLRVLKPGGYLLAFAGTRTQHRMACRIEDAGFHIRDMIAWVYGSGFPKSLDVSKAIDRDADAVRPVIGTRTDGVGNTEQSIHKQDGFASSRDTVFDVTAPATEAAKQWDGWGTALKPALEPITMARKPMIGTVAENILAHGTGAINVDGCRVPAECATGCLPNPSRGFSGGLDSQEDARPVDGRWPANLIHDGSEEVTGLFPRTDASAVRNPTGADDRGIPGFVMRRADTEARGHQDQGGSAARFFYTAKASKEDRDEGLDRQSWATAGAMTGGRAEGSAGLSSPRAGAGRTSGGKNIHPTVKPTALMQYLCRLVTPPGGVVLDNFMGSGSTGKAALLEGFSFIGVEREADYLPIALKRVLSARRESVAIRHIDLQGSLL